MNAPDLLSRCGTLAKGLQEQCGEGEEGIRWLDVLVITGTADGRHSASNDGMLQAVVKKSSFLTSSLLPCNTPIPRTDRLADAMSPVRKGQYM